MTVDTEQIVSVTEANQNFSKVAKLADNRGSVVIFKNNKPRYVLTNIGDDPVFELSDEEKIDVAAKRILEKYRKAFEVLAQ